MHIICIKFMRRYDLEKNTWLIVKKQAIYFKIKGTCFKIYALYFSPLQTFEKQIHTKPLF